jgi:hypothetical protein
VAPIRSLHDGVAQLVDHNGHEHHRDPGYKFDRIGFIFASPNSQKDHHEPKEWMDSNREPKQPEVEIGLGRWWFADKHLRSNFGLRIWDCGLHF